jgi:transcriptional regulator with XRE-family HTH domain
MIRRQAGLSQKALEKMANVSAHTITLLENEKAKSSIEVVAAIADSLGISVDEYIGFKPKRERMPEGLRRYFEEYKRRKI